jgi:hypothetical protein
MCDCRAYQAIPPVPLDQLRILAAGSAVVVVVVPVADWDDSREAAEVIAGDLSQEAHIVMVQRGPGLYYVNKHPEKKLVHGIYTTPETVRENLLRIQAKLRKG